MTVHHFILTDVFHELAGEGTVAAVLQVGSCCRKMKNFQRLQMP